MPTNKMIPLVGIVLISAMLWSSAHAEMLQVDDELTIFYQVSGTGQIPIVFVPGWTMSTKVFEKQLAHFAQSTRYRFYTFDPRGQGKSTKTEGVMNSTVEIYTIFSDISI